MSFGQNLRDLLSPLGVYRWEGSFQWGELQSEGLALDGVAETLAEIQREMNLVTAQGEGLSGIQALLGVDPGARDREELRLALAALLRIGRDSFTLAAMNTPFGAAVCLPGWRRPGTPYILWCPSRELGGSRQILIGCRPSSRQFSPAMCGWTMPFLP